MNKHIPSYIGWIIILLAGISACNTNDIINENTYIRFFTTIEHPDERITSNNFDPNDRIGVFVVPYEADNSTPGILGQSQYANNVEHVYRGGFWEAPNGNMIPWPGNRNVDIYAYHPFDPGLSGPRNYPFTVSSDQSVRSGYIASDFLTARSIGISQSASVPLVFSHTLSKININVRSEITPVKQAMAQTQVYIQNILTGCTIDLQDGSAIPDTGSPVNDITAFKLNVPVSGYDLSMTAVVPSQRIPASTRLLRINNRDVNYVYTTEETLTLQQGFTLTFNIEITHQGIIVTTSTVGQWSDGGTIAGNIGETPPRVLDLDAIDWNRSYVHYIYDENSLIGQVCREYIFRNNVYDIPAIVVYPLGTDGKMDITKGFVARVFNRARNNQNEYDYNTASIHGGSVSYQPDNSLGSYTQGQLPLVNKVLVQSADNIAAASDNSIPTLTVQPYTLTDIDNNTYPVTKIGIQYWIRQNYKAERYTNGQLLEYFYYNNDAATYKQKYGALYRWQTIVSAIFAPEGWRVPTRADWNSLYQYVNPQTGRKIKALNEWPTAAYADDVTGFAGLPGGRRTDGGAFSEFGTWGQWWSATEASTTNAWRIYVGDGTAITENSLGKGYAESVRLMRD